MSLTFDNLTTDAGLKQLDAYLLGRTFVFGVVPSKADLDLLALVTKCPDMAKYKAAARWFNYISDFTEAQRKRFGKSVLTVGLASAAAAAPAKKEAEGDAEDSDDMFGSDDDDEEEVVVVKKKKKRAVLGRSQIIFDIKPVDTEVDLEDLAEKVKEVVMADVPEFGARIEKLGDDRVSPGDICDWGEGHKICPIAFGICKLQVSCCVLDDLMGVDDVKDTLERLFGESIQSIDVAAMNKANALK